MTDLVASWADAGQLDRVELELAGRDELFGPGLAGCLMAFSVLVFLVGELGITASELVVWDVGVNFILVQVFHICFVSEAGVCRNDDAFFVKVVIDTKPLVTILNAFQDGLQGVVFLSFSEGLGINDDLVFLINRSHTVITLDGALARRHLG